MKMITPPSNDELFAAMERRHRLLEESKQEGQWVAKMTEVIEELIRENQSDDIIRLFCGPWSGGSRNPDFNKLIELSRKKLKTSDPAHGLGMFGVSMRAPQYVWTEPERIPMRDWLYGRHLIRKFVSATIAPGAVGKSAMKIVEALAMISGRPLLGTSTEQLRVWYFNLEDPYDEITRRIQSTALHYNLSPEDIGDRLFVSSGRDQPLVIAEMEDGEATLRWPLVEALIEEIKDKGIDVVIIDPFVSCHKVPENLNGAIDMVVKEWGKVADRGDCAIDLVHHVRKGDQAVTVESARGGGAFADACRSVRVLNRMTEDEAKKAGVDNRRLYVSVIDDKANMAPPAEKRDWFKLVSVDLGNSPFGGVGGDSIGVPTKWEWPDPLDGITGGDFDRAAAAIRAGQWRANSQAKGWVGVPIAKALNLSLAVKTEKAKVAGLIKIWLASGALVEVEKPDENRKMKKFIEVAGDDD
ncbi:AAA family ATPase [Bradyrhizobium sp. NBAIM20]|uniref:AAA family ATPase n=1 Tax=unclassified Bradyrhizobium TaxID=2631580 RepID=UPI001CD7A092|nr:MULTISPECIES: helicase RepA family protein [unclassified Bradyrhizobium]MCA1410276.1 AAA family ATPase [Bradyrhizobium sp. NBAIM20]MCA1462516.1 AAA family ATPase [Bradyrhizobium sp. NBAIM18]